MDPFNPVQPNGVDLTTESLKEERDALSRRIQELDKLITAVVKKVVVVFYFFCFWGHLDA